VEGELLGRAAELQRAAAVTADLVAGHGHVLVIRGEQGIGKSALLGEIARRAAAKGARVAAGTAEESEQRLPFASISACLASARTEPEATRIADLLHGTNHEIAGAPTPADIEFIVLEAILSLVDRWCASQPVVLAIDDLQWADRASLLVLHRLGQTAAQLPLLILAACRSGVTDQDLSRLIRS
jgi:predicted ATPase